MAMMVGNRLPASAAMPNDYTAFRADWIALAELRQSCLGVGSTPQTMNDMQIENLLALKSQWPRVQR